jgi:GAF domain-containing protein
MAATYPTNRLNRHAQIFDETGMTGTRARGAAAGASGAMSESLSRLRDVAQAPSAERALDAVPELLGMEIAFVTDMDETEQTMLVLRGDGKTFGIGQGDRIPREETFCHRVLSGRLPNLIPDVRAEDRAASIPAAAAGDIGAYVSVPLTLSDGSVRGTLCAASHDAHPDLGYRDLEFLHVFARIIADGLERDALENDVRGLELRATAAQTLIAAVQSRDAYTADHSREVVDHAVAVAAAIPPAARSSFAGRPSSLTSLPRSAPSTNAGTARVTLTACGGSRFPWQAGSPSSATRTTR